MILKYNYFIEEDLIFEKLINETYVYYVEDFKKILKKLQKSGSEIANDLLNAEFKDAKSDMTFISLSDKEGYVGSSTLRNTKKNIEKSYTDWAKNVGYSEEEITHHLDRLLKNIETGLVDTSDVDYFFTRYNLGKKSRNDVKIGRLVNTILPGKYTSKDIEDFTNKFKAILEIPGERFELVEGDDISYWYNRANYLVESGTLGSSCMRYNSCSSYFKIYTENKDVCKLLILIDQDDKLLGRALVWKISKLDGRKLEEEKWFMDRQYTIEDSDVDKFRNYAKEKGWAYKHRNNHHSFDAVSIDGVDGVHNLQVIVNDKDYGMYPYMDTFRRYDPDRGILYNDNDDDSEHDGQYILEETDGGYEKIQSGVWSDYYNETIPEDDAVYSDGLNTYIWRERAVEVTSGSWRRTGWYPDDYDDVVWDERSEEYIHTDDAVFSEAYGCYILDNNAVNVITDIDRDGRPVTEDWYHSDDEDDKYLYFRSYKNKLWFKKLSDKYSGWDDIRNCLTSLFENDYKGEPILDLFAMSVFKVKGDKPEYLSADYLSSVDADILGIKIDKDDYRRTDKFEYEATVSEVRDRLKNELQSKIIKIKDSIENSNDEEKEKLEKRIKRYSKRFDEISEDLFI